MARPSRAPARCSQQLTRAFPTISAGHWHSAPMEIEKITPRFLGNRIEVRFDEQDGRPPSEIVGTLLSVTHSMPSHRGKRSIESTLDVLVGNQTIEVRSGQGIEEITVHDGAGTKL
jgi:hypothetical protein